MRLCTTTLCTDIGAAENEYLVNEITLNGLPWGPDTAIGVLVCQRSFWEHCVITQASLGLDLIPLGSELERTLGQVVEGEYHAFSWSSHEAYGHTITITAVTHRAAGGADRDRPAETCQVELRQSPHVELWYRLRDGT